MKKSDCVKCGVGQQRFGDLCSLCHYTDTTNLSRRKEIDREQEEMFNRAARKLTWTAIISILITIFVIAYFWSK